jgi:hypothetical protein
MKINRTILTGALAAILACAASSWAETFDFGGHLEKFKGGGDKVPPQCQVEYPRAAGDAFFIKWNCVDNYAARDQIRTELWIYRNGDQAGRLIESFLGFPAAAYIDANQLKVQRFADGLPASFRLVAIDRAGITTISETFTVRAQDNSLTKCTLTVDREATESTGDTTGQPAATVKLSDVEVQTTQSDTQHLVVATKEAASADPCEIDSICTDGDKIDFSAALTLGSDNSAAGSILVTPGALNANVEGTAEISSSVLSTLSVSGDTTIDDVAATVSLDCQK